MKGRERNMNEFNELSNKIKNIIAAIILLKKSINKIWKKIYEKESIQEKVYSTINNGFDTCETYTSNKYGKCPFRKTIHKIHTKEDGIGESFRETIQEEEEFANCLGFGCMAFTYNKIGDIESIGCKRMNE